VVVVPTKKIVKVDRVMLEKALKEGNFFKEEYGEEEKVVKV
jgi:hypothetical protein